MTDKEIKDRIKSVSDTVKITKATQLIATSKLYSNKLRLDSATAYLEGVQHGVSCMVKASDKVNPLFAEGPSEESYYIVVGGDKGLCGDYNHNVFAFADSVFAKEKGNIRILAVGYSARQYYKSKGIKTYGAFIHVATEPIVDDAVLLADSLLDTYLSGKAKVINIIFTENGSLSDQHVCCQRLLPFDYQPYLSIGPVRLEKSNLTAALRELLIARIFYAVASASLAVNYKRMTAMSQATSNGNELVETLRQSYNRNRQSKITNELNDSSAALQGKRI